MKPDVSYAKMKSAVVTCEQQAEVIEPLEFGVTPGVGPDWAYVVALGLNVALVEEKGHSIGIPEQVEICMRVSGYQLVTLTESELAHFNVLPTDEDRTAFLRRIVSHGRFANATPAPATPVRNGQPSPSAAPVPSEKPEPSGYRMREEKERLRKYWADTIALVGEQCKYIGNSGGCPAAVAAVERQRDAALRQIRDGAGVSRWGFWSLGQTAGRWFRSVLCDSCHRQGRSSVLS